MSGEGLRRPGRRHLKESSSIHDAAQDATESGRMASTKGKAPAL